jgi:hypothetical protein
MSKVHEEVPSTEVLDLTAINETAKAIEWQQNSNVNEQSGKGT